MFTFDGVNFFSISQIQRIEVGDSGFVAKIEGTTYFDVTIYFVNKECVSKTYTVDKRVTKERFAAIIRREIFYSSRVSFWIKRYIDSYKRRNIDEHELYANIERAKILENHKSELVILTEDMISEEIEEEVRE